MTMTAYTFISYTFSHLGDTDFLQLQSEKSQGRFQVGSVGGHRSVYLNRTTMTEDSRVKDMRGGPTDGRTVP